MQMTSHLYLIHVPVDKIEPIPGEVSLTLTGYDKQWQLDMLFDRKMRSWFMNHYQRQFDRLFSHDWIVRDREFGGNLFDPDEGKIIREP